MWRQIIVRFFFALLAMTAYVAVASAGAFANAADGELRVPFNQTVVHMLDKPVATVAITDPSIADVSIHNERVLLVIGRSYGLTNLVALDAAGHPIETRAVRVVPVDQATLTLTRGSTAFSYSCSPRCERIAVPTDDEKALGTLVGAIKTRSGLAAGAN